VGAGLVLAAGLVGCGKDTFTVSGTYLFPARGATSSEACRGPHSAEGRRLTIEEIDRTSSTRVAEGRLQAGHLDTTKRYGDVAVCAYPFTVPDVPSGGMGYGASVEHDGGLAFTEEEAVGLVVAGGEPPLSVR
jgi:hypothetical protein